jgi:hypothetical protein
VLEDVRAAVSYVAKTCGLTGTAEDPFVKGVIEAAHRARPREQRAREMWDPSMLREHFDMTDEDEDLSERDLRTKTIALLMQVGRVHLTEVRRLRASTFQMSEGKGMTASVLCLKPKAHQRTVFIPEGPSTKCSAAHALQTYVERIRSSGQLKKQADLVFPEPEGRLRADVKKLMKEAGIPETYKVYTLVHAGTSARMSSHEWSREAECRHGGWSAHSATLEAHYALQSYPKAGALTFPDKGAPKVA